MTGRALLVFSLALVGAASAAGVRVANPDLLKELSPAEQAILAKQGMVARTTDAEQMYDIYIEAADKKLPILVTTDPMFHVFHILYDYSLRAAELDFFYPQMERVLAGLLEYEQARYAEEKNPVVKQALLGNIAYLSVPLSYLRPDFAAPKPVSKPVQTELALIDRGEPGGSAIMGYEEDFTQYKPRGHYTRNERFRRYFKAMMYLCRMTFRLPTVSDTSLAPTRKAILLADALELAKSDAGLSVKELWQRVYDATVYMVGKSDDILPEQYYALARKLAGDQRLSQWVASDTSIRLFVEAAVSELPQPRILSDVLRPLEGEHAGMRLMGQRYIPDSHVFHNLTFSRIPGRFLPMGLDVMAVLGSDRARDYLVNLYHQDQYQGYLAKLGSMRAVFAGFDSTQWNQNAYYGWLYALKLNLAPVKKETRNSLLATFVRSEAYPDKTLITSSASWAQLRHDTILYAKQSYTGATESVIIEKPQPRHVAYVEPRPEVLRQLANLGKQLQDRLNSMGRLNEEVASKLGRYAQMVDRLSGIADDELAGSQMPESDVEFCRGIGGVLKSLTTFSQQFAETYLSESAQAESVSSPPQIRIDRRTGRVDTVWTVQQRRPSGSTYNEDRKMALVADVHTDPTSRNVLEVAVGNPMRMYAVVPCWGQNYLAVGSCFSYYEFTKPMTERMTDAEWQALSPKPPMPEWTRSFVVTE